MSEKFDATKLAARLQKEHDKNPVPYQTDKIIATTPSIIRETKEKKGPDRSTLEKTFAKNVERGLIPRGEPHECFRVTIANGTEFQTIIYDPRNGDPIGFTTVTAEERAYAFELFFGHKIPEPVPPTYTSQVIIPGQARNDAVAATALQYTYEYIAAHSAADKILIQEWAAKPGEDGYRDENMYMNLIDDNGPLYYQPHNGTYQGILSKSSLLNQSESVFTSDLQCKPEKAEIELSQAGYTVTTDSISYNNTEIATLTPEYGWQFTSEANFFDIAMVHHLSRLAELEPSASIEPNLDLVLKDERNNEVFRSKGLHPLSIELKTTKKESKIVWESETITEAEREMFLELTSTGKIQPPYVLGDYGFYDIDVYFSRAIKVLDPRKAESEYIASALLVLNEDGKLVAYDPDNVPLNEWVRNKNKDRKGTPYPVLSGAGFDKYGIEEPIEVVEPIGAYSKQEAFDKVNFTAKMSRILSPYVVLPECKAITEVKLADGQVVYQLLYKRPRSISLDSIVPGRLSSRAIRVLHNTRIMQTALAIKEMVKNNTIHLSLHADNRQIALVKNQLRLYIGDWDEIIALSNWSNKRMDRRVCGFLGNPAEFISAKQYKDEEVLYDFTNNVTLTPRQLVIMRGIQKFLSTEMIGALQLMSANKVPAGKAIPEILYNTIDMLIQAFAQNQEQRVHYATYRNRLLREMTRLSPDGSYMIERNEMDPWDFVPTAVAIVITKWFFPADNDVVKPGDRIGVAPARQRTNLPKLADMSSAASRRFIDRVSLHSLPRHHRKR